MMKQYSCKRRRHCGDDDEDANDDNAKRVDVTETTSSTAISNKRRRNTLSLSTTTENEAQQQRQQEQRQQEQQDEEEQLHHQQLQCNDDEHLQTAEILRTTTNDSATTPAEGSTSAVVVLNQIAISQMMIGNNVEAEVLFTQALTKVSSSTSSTAAVPATAAASVVIESVSTDNSDEKVPQSLPSLVEVNTAEETATVPETPTAPETSTPTETSANETTAANEDGLLPTSNVAVAFVEECEHRNNHQQPQQQQQHRSQYQEYDEGMNTFSEAIEIDSIICKEDDSLKMIALLYNVGQTYMKRYNFPEARMWFQYALSTFNMALTTTQITAVESARSTPSSAFVGTTSSSTIRYKILDALAYSFYRQAMYNDALYWYDIAYNYAIDTKMGVKYIAATKTATAVVMFHRQLAAIVPVGGSSTVVSSSVMEQCNATNASSSTTALNSNDDITLLEESLCLYQQDGGYKHIDSDHTISSSTCTQCCYVKEIATIYNTIGRICYFRGRHEQALVSFQAALRFRRTFLPTTSIDLLVTVCNLGQTYHQLNQFDPALELFIEFLSFAQINTSAAATIPSSNTKYNDGMTTTATMLPSPYASHRDICIVVASIASIHLHRHELTDAQKMYEIALQYGKIAFGPIHSEVACILNKLGAVCYKLKQLDASLLYLKDGLKIEQTVYGLNHPNVIVTILNIAQIHRDRNNYGCAFLCYSHAHSAQMANAATVASTTTGSSTTHATNSKARVMMANTIAISDTLFSMGLMLYKMKAYSSAFEYYQQALMVQRNYYGDDTNHTDIASTLNSMAIVLFHMGKKDTARYYFEESLQMRRKLYGTFHHPDIATNLFNLATLHLESGDHSRAFALYKETLQVERTTHGPNSNEVIQTLQLLGLLHQHNGELSVALRYFIEALEIVRGQINQHKQQPTDSAEGNDKKTLQMNDNTLLLAKLCNLIGNIHLQRGNVAEMMHYYSEATYLYQSQGLSPTTATTSATATTTTGAGSTRAIAAALSNGVIIAGYNFYSISKLHPECAEAA